MARDVVVIGASAGGIEAVSKVLAELPGDFPAFIFVVVHLLAEHNSSLPRIFSRAGLLPAVHPKDREPFRKGIVYVAPPDRHLVIDENRVRLIRGPKENLHRPAIDPLFRSAAFQFRSRVIGVLLTGADSDGTSGLLSIKIKGGQTVVQDPQDALAPQMPFSALTNLRIDYVPPLKEVGPLLRRLIMDGRMSGGGKGV